MGPADAWRRANTAASWKNAPPAQNAPAAKPRFLLVELFPSDASAATAAVNPAATKFSAPLAPSATLVLVLPERSAMATPMLVAAVAIHVAAEV